MKLLFWAMSILIPAMAGASQDSENIDAIRNALESKKLSEKELTPKGFRKAAEAKGDLNADGTPDMVLVIHKLPKKPAKSSSSEENADSYEDEDMRQYVVLFLGGKDGRYSYWKFGASHILDTNPNLMEEDGIGTLEIKKGVLTISTSIGMSMGGWSAGGCTQKWRNEKSGFRLIGLTISNVDRSCACGTTTDINFLTGFEIYNTDQDGEGNQMENALETKTRKKRKAVLWEGFNYEEMCQSG